MNKLIAVALLCCLNLAPAAFAADSYRVDVLVFRFLGPPDESGTQFSSGLPNSTIELTDNQGLQAAGIKILPQEQFGLNPEWASLRASAQFRPLIKLAWIQKQPPEKNGPSLRIKSGESFVVNTGEFSTQEVYEIDGRVGLAKSRYLHLEADLTYTLADAGGVRSWRLNERRRLRRDELHHLDSPKLGLLVRVNRAGSNTP
ncbi:MAG: CsiV family protein [Panacagrimonas sp.]